MTMIQEKQHLAVLTVKDTAHYLRLSEMTILRLANQGALPGAKVGRQWRFPREAILKLVGSPESAAKLE